jgi:hypothetical protein
MNIIKNKLVSIIRVNTYRGSFITDSSLLKVAFFSSIDCQASFFHCYKKDSRSYVYNGSNTSLVSLLKRSLNSYKLIILEH